MAAFRAAFRGGSDSGVPGLKLRQRLMKPQHVKPPRELMRGVPMHPWPLRKVV